jgi:hypothetical protein
MTKQELALLGELWLNVKLAESRLSLLTNRLYVRAIPQEHPHRVLITETLQDTAEKLKDVSGKLNEIIGEALKDVPPRSVSVSGAPGKGS